MGRLRSIWTKILYAGFSIFLLACHTSVPKEERATNPPTDQIHLSGPIDAYNGLLRRHINRNGDIHYKGFLADRSSLKLYIDYLESVNIEDTTYTRSEKMAFYINAYNAGAIYLIIQHYPLHSITQIGADTEMLENTNWISEHSPEKTSPFDLPVLQLANKPMSLNEIKSILRNSFEEPRIHFALVNGTRGAPKLSKAAYDGKMLNRQLEEAVREFFQLPDKNRLHPSTPLLAPMMRDFANDFETDSTNLMDFVNRYSRIRIHPSATPEFLSYDWQLNGY